MNIDAKQAIDGIAVPFRGIAKMAIPALTTNTSSGRCLDQLITASRFGAVRCSTAVLLVSAAVAWPPPGEPE